MTIYSDHEAAELALDIEELFDINMNLKDMFSDELNNYFDYIIDKSNNEVIFCFELDEGSCKLTVHNPFDDYERFSFNKILENVIKQKQI